MGRSSRLAIGAIAAAVAAGQVAPNHLGAAVALALAAVLLVSEARPRLRVAALLPVVVGAAALLASLVMTTVYHLGYRDFRSPLLVRPVAADLVWSVPTLVTLNPIGAPIAHAGMHVAAVLHSYDTQVFLPPHR